MGGIFVQAIPPPKKSGGGGYIPPSPGIYASVFEYWKIEFSNVLCKNFASELAQTYFLEFDVLSLAYIRIVYIAMQ